MASLKTRFIDFLRFTERYTKTDMVYLLQGGFWMNLGSISVSLFSFALYLAFAHFLPKEVYGTYQYLLSLGAIVGALTLTGMNSALTRAVAQGNEGTVAASIPFQLTWGLLPLIASWAGGAYYLAHHNTTLGYGLFLIGIFVPLNNALNSYVAWIGGRKDFRAAFLYNLLTNVLYYPALIIAAYYSSSALILLAANLLSQGIALAIGYTRAQHKYQPNALIDREAFSYGKHLSVMGVMGTIAGQVDSILAFHMLGANPLALYSFATALPDRIASLVKFIPSIALPKLANRTPEEVRRTLPTRLSIALLGSAAVAGIYMLLAHTFFSIFFPQYIQAVPYSILYALAIIPTVGGLFTAALTAYGSVRSLYILNTAVPILQLVLMVLGISWLGLMGLIIAKIVTYSIQFILGAILIFFFKEDGAMPITG